MSDPSSSSSSESSSDSEVSSRGSSRRLKNSTGRVRGCKPRHPERRTGRRSGVADPDQDLSPAPEIPQDPMVPLEGERRRHPRDEEKDQNPRAGKRHKEGRKETATSLFRGVGATDSKVIKGRYLASFKKRSTTFKCLSLDDALYQRLKQVKGSSASKNTIDHNEKALYCVQQKILEAAQPLLFLSYEKLDDDAHREAISVAIQLLGDSFHEVTQQWRRNVLRQTSPSYLYLLDDQDNFNTKEASSLFGKSFVKSMVRSSQQQTMLSNLQPVQRLSGQPYRNGGHQFRHPDGHNNRPSGQSTSHRHLAGYVVQHTCGRGHHHLG
ncbi:hypothetical protein OUZ56_029718 [Daphnia magna]|uniref:Uncharacterized protein n=1 Tax=Daphnia magna TaxID=35525 RepID=A0ABR0B7M0_9CRUS|nr:hypothetical protein OUZ56_029718 [Daphnia magna]